MIQDDAGTVVLRYRVCALRVYHRRSTLSKRSIMFELLVIIPIVGAVIVWFHLLAVKDLALAAAKRHCRQMGVQFLDGSVVLTGVKLTRSSSGSRALAQRFQFDFTVTGERRYRGQTVFVGKRQVSMQLDPHVEPHLSEEQ